MDVCLAQGGKIHMVRLFIARALCWLIGSDAPDTNFGWHPWYVRVSLGFGVEDDSTYVMYHHNLPLIGCCRH